MAEGAHLQPLDFNGFNLASGTYAGAFLVDFDIAAQFPLEAVMAESAGGDFPTFVRGDPQDKVIPLHVRVNQIAQPLASQAIIDEIKKAFSPSNPIAYLRVTDELAHTRRMRVKSLGVTPWEGYDDFAYVASLHAPEPVWENDAAEGGTSTLSGTGASGNDFSMPNAGNERTFPAFRLTPKVQKPIGDGYQDHWPITVAWRSNLEGVDSLGGPYPTDITNHAWDTATLVAGGDLQADGDDIRVFVDGVEVDRYLADMDSANTGVWCNIAFQPMRSATLATAGVIAGTPANGGTLEVSDANGTAAFPERGMLLIDDECITYNGKTFESFLDIRRGRRGTTAAAHSVGATIYWVEHDIRIISGLSTASNPRASVDFEPMLDLANSLNTEHVYNTTEGMIAPGTQRSGQWLRERRSKHIGAPLLSMIQTSGEVRVRDTLPTGDAPNFDSLTLYAPCLIISGSASSINFGGASIGHELQMQWFGADQEGFETLILQADVTTFQAPPKGYFSGTPATVAIAHTPAAALTRFTHHVSPGKLTGSIVRSDDTVTVGEAGTRIAQGFDLRDEDPILGAVFYVSKSGGGTRDLIVILAQMTDAGPTRTLTSVTIAAADLPTTKSKMSVDFSGVAGIDERRDQNIPPGAYALIFQAGAGSGTITVYYSQFEQTYAGGETWNENGSNVWTNEGSLQGDLAFFVTSRLTNGQPDTDFTTDEYVMVRAPSIDLSPNHVPDIVMGARQDGYLVDATLQNMTTGQVITIIAPLVVNQSMLKIDCDAHAVTVIYMTDDHETDAFQLVQPGGLDFNGALQGDILEWMRLDAGTQLVKYLEANPASTAVEIERRFRSRWT